MVLDKRFRYSSKQFFEKYISSRYGFPAAIVGISVVISEVLYDTTRYGTENFCWLTHNGGFTFAFVGPVIVILFLNVVFLSIAMYQVRWLSSPNVVGG